MMATFAANVFSRFGINYSARNVDNLLVGWRYDAVALGFYKKAYDLFALVAGQLVAPLADVALTTLSRLRSDSAEYTRYLVNSLGIIAFVGMAVGADLTLVGKDVVRLVLGPQWSESGKIFTLFGPGIGVMLLYSTNGWIHLSIGRPDRWLRWAILEFTVTSLLIILGLRWGPEGIGLAWSVSFWMLLIPAFWYAGRPIQFRVSHFLSAVWKYVVASVVAGWVISVAVGNSAFSAMPAGAEDALARLVVISILFGALYLCAVILLHRSLAPIRDLTRLLRELAPFRRRAEPLAA